ncbi:MAG TPA: hypothetical protein VHD33_06460, partial [Legionellaceae bacterium]|nr:hypothetical protein [Legionellaceae bacterium]
MPTKSSIFFTRSSKNPFLKPNPDVAWEKIAAFNPCVVKKDKQFHLLYRAMGRSEHFAQMPNFSTIAYAESNDGIDFIKHRQLIIPTETWERFGCEDPRVTYLNKKYYIFYTALSEFPFVPSGIRIGMAITKDFKEIIEKQLITPFNAKAMALFPEKINGQ